MILPIFYVDFYKNEVYLGSYFMMMLTLFLNLFFWGEKIFDMFLMQNLLRFLPQCDQKTPGGI